MKVTNNSKRGFNLTEIMLAMTILAAAFIPIIGVMGNSVKITDKDNRTILAVNLCQQKLNKALQFPFGELEPAPGGTRSYGLASQTLRTKDPNSNLSLLLTPKEELEGLPGVFFSATLKVEDIPIGFTVPTYDTFEKAKFPNTPGNWKFVTLTKNLSGVFSKYTVSVSWNDAGRNEVKNYTLVSFKARTRQ